MSRENVEVVLNGYPELAALRHMVVITGPPGGPNSLRRAKPSAS